MFKARYLVTPICTALDLRAIREPFKQLFNEVQRGGGLKDFRFSCGELKDHSGKKMAGERHAWLKEKWHNLKHNEGEAKRLHRELEKASPGNNRTVSLEKLIKARTYFKNHWQQMMGGGLSL